MSEILGTLFKYLLALLAIAAVVVVLYEALSSGKVSETVSDITTLRANITQLASASDGGSITPVQLINAGAVPANMVNGKNIYDPWGGALNFIPSEPGMVGIQLLNVPTKACIKLVMALAPAMQEIDISSNPVSGSGGSISQGPVTLSLDKVTTNCIQSNLVTVYFPAHVSILSPQFP